MSSDGNYGVSVKYNVEFYFYDYLEFVKFMDDLPSKDRDKLLFIILNIRKRGLLTAFKMRWVKKISNNLYEIRSRHAKNYQRCLYFHLINRKYVITNYFTKTSNKTPINEINKSIERRKLYLRRKR